VGCGAGVSPAFLGGAARRQRARRPRHFKAIRVTSVRKENVSTGQIDHLTCYQLPSLSLPEACAAVAGIMSFMFNPHPYNDPETANQSTLFKKVARFSMDNRKKSDYPCEK
jgi:hypothetical protein